LSLTCTEMHIKLQDCFRLLVSLDSSPVGPISSLFRVGVFHRFLPRVISCPCALERGFMSPKPSTQDDSFSDLVARAPHLSEARGHSTLIGHLFRGDQKQTFILHANDGNLYEIDVDAVVGHKVLHDSKQALIVQIELPAERIRPATETVRGYPGAVTSFFTPTLSHGANPWATTQHSSTPQFGPLSPGGNMPDIFSK
jgi:hypothetical protein